MSLSGTLSSAMSGLNAASRAAQTVSSNISNAMTEGYGRRELELGARVIGTSGQGVQVNGVQRMANMVAIGDRRYADAGLADTSARASFFRSLEAAIGMPDSADSLSGRVAAFDASLISAAAHPDSESRLNQVAEAARAVVNRIVSASKAVQSARSRADDQIEAQVKTVNLALQQVADLNAKIRSSTGVGGDASALVDQRQQVIDSIAGIIPLREIPRDNGTVALFSASGAVLLDGQPSQLGFVPVGVITPEMTLASGALSGLTLNGNPVPLTGSNSLISGGSLAANFAVRDDLAVKAQGKLDAVARDLVERFADPAVDPTLAVGDAGLFTDGGLAFDELNELGLAQRLKLNAAADPQQGGQLWRLRAGLGATDPGQVGASTLLSALQTALTAERAPVSGDFMAGTRSMSVLVGDLISGVSTQRLGAESETSFAQGKNDALKAIELEGGVDTDAEMQRLLLIEQAYSANAKVMQMVDDMMNTLMRI
jgi:flagellar hook-associated protein 1 FlgK